MKNKKRLIVAGSLSVGIVLLGTLFFWIYKELDEATDFCTDKGSGKTVLEGRVVDYITSKLIDSLDIQIRYGISADVLVDSMVLQKDDGYKLEFIIDSLLYYCEPVWCELSNPYYDTELYGPDKRNNYGIDVVKGKINKAGSFYMHPLVFVRDNIKCKQGRTTPKRVELTVMSAYDTTFTTYDSADFKRAELIRNNDDILFTPINNLNFYYSDTEIILLGDIRSSDTIRCTWKIISPGKKETFQKTFLCHPFDTIEVNIEF